ncbi:MAG: rod-binding protein [Planctomycetes bacterium]|nr:rod-binding protein [Planctomycetota bacterium]MCH9727600.1 rod-binding protein [Planctomycetota bacterium]MCH9777420.1 rod-binding protein [Planctomycetota bacterium]MCH9791998.1 rod-binding protein [Planctomycetota bacterium]
MTPLSGIQPSINHTSLLSDVAKAPSQLNQARKESTELKEAFQKFVAGTFYKQMFKAMREGQNKPAYFHGGQAEEMFQSQLDQQISEDLATREGGGLADTLFSAFSRQINAKSAQSLELSSSVTP